MWHTNQFLHEKIEYAMKLTTYLRQLFDTCFLSFLANGCELEAPTSPAESRQEGENGNLCALGELVWRYRCRIGQ
jgi:hypothetical protein